jgi:hypothetical protein
MRLNMYAVKADSDEATVTQNVTASTLNPRLDSHTHSDHSEG